MATKQILLSKILANGIVVSLSNHAKQLTTWAGIFPQKEILKNKKHHCVRQGIYGGPVSVPTHQHVNSSRYVINLLHSAWKAQTM